MFGHAAVPSGYLTCDGAAVSRSTFAALFAAIGTGFGVGDGATTFNLPDMRGRTPVGVGAGPGLTARSRNAQGGEETHQLSVGEMPSHNHGSPTRYGAGNNAIWDNNDAGLNAQAGSTRNTAVTDPNGGSAFHNNMPPYTAVLVGIKT